MQLGSPDLDVQMFHDESWKYHLFWVRGSKVTVISSVLYCRCCHVCKLRWDFPAVMPRLTSNASEPGLSVRHFPAFAGRWVFPDVGFCTLVSASFL